MKLADQVWATGFNVYSPQSAFLVHGDSKPDASLMKVNERGLDVSDGALFVWPKGAPTVGTPLEIARSVEMSMPTVVVAEGNWLEGSWVFPWLRSRVDWDRLFVCETIEQALVWLAEMLDVDPVGAGGGDKATRADVAAAAERASGAVYRCPSCGPRSIPTHDDGCRFA